MPSNHPAVAALPINAGANKTLLRNVNIAAFPYVVPDTDSPANLIAVDPDTGAAVVDIHFQGRLFHYDPTDMVTAHDGVTCLVSSEGRRYKLSDGSDVFCYSVLDRTRTAPPASPSLGNAHLVAAAATGAWVGKDGNIAVRTARGWEFIVFGVGRFIYVEDIDTYYHRNSGGAWVPGFGSQTTQPNSIPLSAAINFGKRLIVESRTLTAPPASPTVGTAYIIGASATGAWAGHDLDIAICEVAGTFTIYDPTNGWTAYDKATNQEYVFNGTAWASAAGAWIAEKSVFTAAGITAQTGSNFYSYSDTVAPVAGSQLRNTDDVHLTYTARKSGAKLRFTYQASIAVGTVGACTIALFRDAVSAALAWQFLYVAGVGTTYSATFEISAPDALAHDYFVAVMYSSGVTISGMSRRLFALQESSQ